MQRARWPVNARHREGLRLRSVGAHGLALASAVVALALPTDASTWHRRYGAGGDATFATTLDGPGGSVLVGHVVPLDGLHRARAFRIDENGSPIWSRRLNVHESTLIDAVRLPDGSFVAVGLASVGAGSTTGLVVRFDADGNLLWERRFERAPDWNFGFNAVILAPSGVLLMAGQLARGVVDPVIAAMSIEGDLLWHLALENTSPGGSARVVAPRLVSTADGGVLLVGQCGNVAGQWIDGWLVKFDALQRVEWQNAYGGAELQAFSDALERADGSFVVVGVDGDQFGASAPWIVSISATGALTSQWVFPAGQDARDVVAMSDGGALIGGIVYPSEAFLLKVDPSTVLEWGLIHGTGTGGFSHLMVDATGGVIALGNTERWTDPPSPWAMHLDDAGRAADACWPIESEIVTVPTTWSVTPTTMTLNVPPLTPIVDPAAALEPDALAEVPWCGPDEITNLRASRLGGDAIITWAPDPRAATYEVYRGRLAAFDTASYDHTSIGACDLPALTHSDAVILDGGSYYYLVVGRNAWGLSPFGFASTGAATPAASPLCP